MAEVSRIDHVGKRYHRLVVVNDFIQDGRRWFLVLCDCNTWRVVRAANVVNGHTRSCGCLARGVAGGAAWRARSAEVAT